MKPFIKEKLLIIFFGLFTSSGFAQDVIHLRTGTEVNAIVKKVTDEKIEYVKFEKQDGPLYEIAISKVFKIKYKDGSQDVFPEAPAPSTTGAGTQTQPQSSTTIHQQNNQGKDITQKEKENDNDVNVNIHMNEGNGKPNESGSTTGNTSGSNSGTKKIAADCPEQTGDANFVNKTNNPLTVFLKQLDGNYQTLSIPIGDSATVYSLPEGVYYYIFKPSNSGEFDQKTKQMVIGYEANGSFKAVKCQTKQVLLKR